jgi:putative intracellular protease/amidase
LPFATDRSFDQRRCSARQKTDGGETDRGGCEKRGGEFYDQEVVVDNNQLVTSRTPDDLPAFNREALRLLGA